MFLQSPTRGQTGTQARRQAEMPRRRSVIRDSMTLGGGWKILRCKLQGTNSLAAAGSSAGRWDNESKHKSDTLVNKRAAALRTGGAMGIGRRFLDV